MSVTARHLDPLPGPADRHRPRVLTLRGRGGPPDGGGERPRGRGAPADRATGFLKTDVSTIGSGGLDDVGKRSIIIHAGGRRRHPHRLRRAGQGL